MVGRYGRLVRETLGNPVAKAWLGGSVEISLLVCSWFATMGAASPQAKHCLTGIAANRLVRHSIEKHSAAARALFTSPLPLPTPARSPFTFFLSSYSFPGRTARKLLGNFHEKCQRFTVRPSPSSLPRKLRPRRPPFFNFTASGTSLK